MYWECHLEWVKEVLLVAASFHFSPSVSTQWISCSKLIFYSYSETNELNTFLQLSTSVISGWQLLLIKAEHVNIMYTYTVAWCKAWKCCMYACCQLNILQEIIAQSFTVLNLCTNYNVYQGIWWLPHLPLVLMFCLLLFVTHLKLELLMQFPTSNDEK